LDIYFVPGDESFIRIYPLNDFETFSKEK